MADQRWAVVCAALSMVGSIVHAGAQEAEPGPRPGEDRRTLAGHPFSPSPIVVDPFTPTFFDSTTGVGVAVATAAPFYTAGGALSGTQSRSFAGFGLSLAYQHAITSWLALRAGGQMLVLSGTDSVSLLSVGATARGTAGDIGLTLGWDLGRRARLGATFDVGYALIGDFNAVTPLVRAINERSFSAGGLLTTTQRLELRPGFVWAVAAHRALGFFGFLQYVHEFSWTNDVSTNEDAILFGAAVDFAVREISPAPITLQLGYRFTGIFSSGSERNIEHAFDLGLYYTGRGALVLGPAFTVYDLRLYIGPERLFQPGERVALESWVFIPQIVCRYFW